MSRASQRLHRGSWLRAFRKQRRGANTAAWSKQADIYPPKIAEKARAAYAAHADMFKAALRAGVPIALGTDASVFPHGMNGMEFALMTELGMSPTAGAPARPRAGAPARGRPSNI